MMIGTGKYGYKHILIKHNHLLAAWDEEILTGCKTNRSSFRGFVRLVPKIIKPELMPAEWRALSRLGGKTQIYRLSFFTWVFFFGGNDVRRNKKTRVLDKYCDLLWNEESNDEQQRNQDEENTQQYLKSSHNETPHHHTASFQWPGCWFWQRLQIRRLSAGVDFLFPFNQTNFAVMSFVKERPYGLACHSLAPILEVMGEETALPRHITEVASREGKRCQKRNKPRTRVQCIFIQQAHHQKRQSYSS